MNKKDKIIGKWISVEESGSEVVYIISKENRKYKIDCYDGYDKEKPEIFNVKQKDNKIYFSLYWNKSGRFSKNVIMLSTDNQIELTYTYTDKDILVKKK